MDRPFDDIAIFETGRKADVIVISKRSGIAVCAAGFHHFGRPNLRTG